MTRTALGPTLNLTLKRARVDYTNSYERDCMNAPPVLSTVINIINTFKQFLRVLIISHFTLTAFLLTKYTTKNPENFTFINIFLLSLLCFLHPKTKLQSFYTYFCVKLVIFPQPNPNLTTLSRLTLALKIFSS